MHMIQKQNIKIKFRIRNNKAWNSFGSILVLLDNNRLIACFKFCIKINNMVSFFLPY